MFFAVFLKAGFFLLVITVKEAIAGRTAAFQEKLTASSFIENVIMSPPNSYGFHAKQPSRLNVPTLDLLEVELPKEVSPKEDLPNKEVLTEVLPNHYKSNTHLSKWDSPKMDISKTKWPIEYLPKLDLLKLTLPEPDLPKPGFKGALPKLDLPIIDTSSHNLPEMDSPKSNLPKLDLAAENMLKQDLPRLPELVAPRPKQTKRDLSSLDFTEPESLKADSPSLDWAKDTPKQDLAKLDLAKPTLIKPVLTPPIVLFFLNLTKVRNAPSNTQTLFTRVPKNTKTPPKSKDHIAQLVNDITSVNCQKWKSVSKQPTTKRQFNRARDAVRSPTSGQIEYYVELPESSSGGSSNDSRRGSGGSSGARGGSRRSSIGSMRGSSLSSDSGNPSSNALKRKANDDDSQDEVEVDSMMVDKFKKYGDRPDKRPKA